MHDNTTPMFRIVNTEGRVLLATNSGHTAVRLATCTAAFRGVVQMWVFGEWAALDDVASSGE